MKLPLLLNCAQLDQMCAHMRPIWMVFLGGIALTLGELYEKIPLKLGQNYKKIAIKLGKSSDWAKFSQNSGELLKVINPPYEYPPPGL